MPEKKGDKTYIRVTDFYMRPDVGSMFITVTNENPESRELSKSIKFCSGLYFGNIMLP